MTNTEVFENKVSLVKKYLTILQRYRSYSQAQIENDFDLKGALERYLYLAIQSTIDLAEALVSFKKLRKPTKLSESFLILNENGYLEKELMQKMVQMTGFRNIIAHDYADINFSIVYDVLMYSVKDIEDFLSKVEDCL